MTNHWAGRVSPPRIEYLKVANFRALRDVELKNLAPITVLLGPNGSGKSTVFDVFAFLAECFETGLRRAWDRRGRGRELKTRGAEEAVTIEIKYRERPGSPLITYHLAVDEAGGAPVVVHEWLRWKRGRAGELSCRSSGRTSASLRHDGDSMDRVDSDGIGRNQPFSGHARSASTSPRFFGRSARTRRYSR